MRNWYGDKGPEIEQARQQLFAEFATKGMRNLVDQMDNKELFSPLIAEARDKSIAYNAADTMSWQALEYSKTLRSAEDKRELVQLLSDPAYAGKRLHILRCLACICNNTQDLELFELFMQIIDKEDDDIVIVSILARIDDVKKPSHVNIAPLKKLLVEGTFQSRMAAAKALRHTNDPEVETLVLEELKISDKDTQRRLCLTLESIGTRQSIPILKEALKETRDRGFRAYVERTIAAIEKREDLT